MTGPQINAGALGQWSVLAGPGFTETGRVSRFQDRTVERLQGIAETYGSRTFGNLKRAVASTYVEGEGTLLGTLQYRVFRNKGGVSVEFSAGGRHVVFLTSLAGQGTFNPAGHQIPRNGVSRFYWRNPLYGLPEGIYRFTPQRPAHWRTRQGRDVISEVLTAGARDFAQVIVAEHDRALVEFVQNDLNISSRSPRVNVRAGSGIAPQ